MAWGREVWSRSSDGPQSELQERAEPVRELKIITDLFGLEGTCGDHPAQLPCQGRDTWGRLSRNVFGGSGISPEKETPHPPGAAAPLLCHPQRKEAFPHVEVKFLVF